MPKSIRDQTIDIVNLSFRLEGRDPFEVPQDQWAARCESVRAALASREEEPCS